MENALMVPLRKKSMSHSVVDLRLNLTPTPSATTASGDRQISAPPVTSGGAEVKTPDSPRQPTMSLPSEAAMTESITESASDQNTTKDGSASVRTRRGSATMRSFLQRVMRSQSDCHIRIAPLVHSEANGSTTVTASVSDAGAQNKKDETRCNDCHTDDCVDSANEDSAVQVPVEGDVEVTDGMSQTQTSEELYLEQQEAAAAVGLCDTFLNSSLQLLQVQSDAKQRVRQLWTCAQKLRWENQLSDSGLESLHHELLAVMKALTVEKLEGPRHIKAGYLTLVQAPPAVVAANLVHRGVAAATKSLLLGGGVMKTSLDQRVWVSLSEEQCRMELVPYERPAPPPTQPAQPSANSESIPTNGATATTFPKFKLPTSISWLLSDPSQAKDDDSMWIGRTAIKLQGCQVRRMFTPSGGSGSMPVRFQVLVPTSDPSHLTPSAPVVSTAVVPDQSLASSYGVYVFEIPLADAASADHERDEWIRAIDRVCAFHLYALEQQLREACFMLQFRDVLASSFPVTVPLTWLRNRLEKMPSMTATMSAQQHAQYQYQQLQRRSSRNLSMVQIVKDLERDRILVDKKVLISCTGPTPTASGILCQDDSSVVEHDSVAEIVKYLVAKAMAFTHTNTKPAHTKSARTSLPHGKPPVACSPSSTSSGSDPQGLMSPSSRLAKFTEARALAFVERVLRGSSRTQSGGDIYDAISFFCQQRHLMICPMSHDAHPVQLNVLQDRDDGGYSTDDAVTTETKDDDASFQIEIEVSMQFKVVEMPAMAPPRFDDDAARCDAMAMASPRDWAVLEGTLRRQFTLGKLSEPGSVTVKYIPDPERPHPQ
jgi:hypothetical protein